MSTLQRFGRSRHWLLVTASLAACHPESATKVSPPRADASPPVPPGPRAARPAIAGATTSDVDGDVSALVLPQGARAVQIGSPALRLASPESYGAMMSSAGELVAIADSPRSVALWSLATGALVRRIRAPDEGGNGQVHSYYLSPSGAWLAVSFARTALLYRRPFDEPPEPLSCYSVYAVSTDETRAICDGGQVIEVPSRKVVAKSPSALAGVYLHDTALSVDLRSSFWISEREIVKWDFTDGRPPLPLYRSVGAIERGVLSIAGDRAVIQEGGRLREIDLRTGASQVLPELRPVYFQLSPSGRRLVYTRLHQVLSYELATGRETLLATAAGDVRGLVLSETDETVGFVEVEAATAETGFEERAALRVIEGAAGVRRYPAASRFVRWVGPATAALERAGVGSTLVVSTAERGPAAAAQASGAPPGVPSWASWASEVAGRPASGVRSEARPRGAVRPAQRWRLPCEATLRLWLDGAGAGAAGKPPPGASPSAGREKTLSVPCSGGEVGPERQDPGWFHGGGWIVAGRLDGATVFDAQGERVGKLELGRPQYDRPQLAHELWNVALAPDGKHVALLWRRGDYGGDAERHDDPREDAQHVAESISRVDCVRRDDGECQREYFLELWALGPAPTRVWKERLTSTRSQRYRVLEPKEPSGPLTFDASGARVLVGFGDGDVLVRTLRDGEADAQGRRATAPVVPAHQVAVVRLEVSPDGGWVFSEDASGEQRIWAMPAR